MRWIGRNLGSLFLAFILAVIVWVSAVVSTDPNEERPYPNPLELEVIGLDPGYVITEEYESQIGLILNAPRSIWNKMVEDPDHIRTWIDLSGLGEGEHTVEVRAQVDLTPVQIVEVEPAEVEVVLEPFITHTFPVQLSVTGDPALGYRKSSAYSDPFEVTVSGQESLVSQVVEVRAGLDVTGANDTVRENVAVQALDENRDRVFGVTITPPTVNVTQPIILQGGYRNVVVKVVTTGEVANGYWLTNVSVSPPNVTVFSSNPQLVNDLPGFVETDPIDLTGLDDDVDVRATLNLPEEVTLAGEESVLVRLGIAALEGSLPISIPIEAIGLTPEHEAILSPDSVDLLLAGPLTILNSLNPASIRVIVDLTGLETGTHQVSPVVDLLPSQVSVASILPETVAVRIIIAPTPTPETTPALLTLTPQPTPTP